VLPGDVLQKRDGRFAVSAGGGLFVCSDPVQDQERMEAGEVVPTGPMFGHRMKPAAPGSPAAAREEALLAAEELSLASFAPAGKLAEGTRRAIAVTLAEVTVRIVDEASIEVGFALPAGAYATAVLRELIKAPESSSDQPAGAIP
jgi:tRNA pseudouridine13 synthase